MSRKTSALALVLGVTLGVILASPSARAANITLQGTIGTDDAVQLFNVTVADAGLVDIRSYGYTGGTTSTGTVVPRGGFDTILTLFDGSGAFLTDNDEGAGVAIDPITGMAADARITMNLAAGNYIVAVTQFDNFAWGFNLSDGFIQTGNPNFTADPAFTSGGPCATNMFRDISGTEGRCRNGNWTVDFVNVASVTPVPEPSAMLLAGMGLVLLLAVRGRNRHRATLLLGGLVAALASVPAHAQTTCPPVSSGPNYCAVSDFLSGKRKLLAIDDLVISGYISNSSPWLPDLYTATMNSANSQLSPGPLIDDVAGPVPQNGPPTFAGHIFNLPTATTVVLRPDQPGECALYLPLAPSQPCDPAINGLVPTAGAVADFNQDGYDEVAVTGVMNGLNVILLARAADVNNISIQPTFLYGPTTQIDPLTNITIGDFNGDGQPEIAGLLTSPSGGIQLVIYTVDPNTLAVSKASQITLQKTLTFDSCCAPNFSITAGNFTSLVHDQIVVASGGFVRTDPNGGLWYTRLELIDFPPSSLTPQETTTTDRGTLSFQTIKVKSGRFGFPGNLYQQVVHAEMGATAVAGIGSGYSVSIFSINPSTLGWTQYPLLHFTNDCAYDMAVGNFDNQQPDPLNPGQTQHNLNDQIAMLHGACGSGGRTIDIVKADAQTLKMSLASITPLPSSLNDLVSMSIGQSDTQGRSLMLGQPTKITISQPVQPSVVISAPPMHVDWISPDPLDNVPPQVMNLSAVPDGFNTTYEVENTTDKQSGTTNGTSWSLGTKVSAGGFIQFGDPDVAGIKISDMSTAAQDLKRTAEQENGSYTRSTYNIYQATGFGDQVSYIESDFNIWVYPILGQSVCPAATPNCSQKVPLTIQFSAPTGDAVTHEDQGQALQWYQPPWEPGNIFSYPANFAQLQSIYPNVAKLTSDGAEFLTDTSTETQKTTWAVGTNTSQTASVEQNFSNENDFSAEGSASFLDFGGGASVNYDTSGSNGLSNLTKSASDLGTSTGIAVKKPGTFPPFGLYGYSVSPYILGTAKPGGVVDQQPLSTDVQTFGLIRGLFTADPLASNAGGWWQQAYSQAPDVALNHPSRWQVVFQGLSNPVPPNCLTTGTGASQMDCAELSYRAPNNPWLSSFHQMRGFFISNANSPGQGPQLEQAKAGDVLTLQARVYNYSLAPMPIGSQVHVRFYFQPWKGTVPAGDSVLIDEQKLDPIPPFSESVPPNWVLASATFDTSKYNQTNAGNAYIAFWAVVWIQGADGQIVKEMPGHSLTSIPRSLKSLADASQLEEIASDNHSYDNNVGFYKQAFYIAPNTPGVGAPPPAARGLIDVGKANVSVRTITPHDTTAVSATLSTSGGPVSGITAAFYDGDPRKDGRKFGVERVPYIAADTSYDVATTFRTNTCGTHHLFIVLNERKAGEIVRRTPPVRVDCRTF